MKPFVDQQLPGAPAAAPGPGMNGNGSNGNGGNGPVASPATSMGGGMAAAPSPMSAAAQHQQQMPKGMPMMMGPGASSPSVASGHGFPVAAPRSGRGRSQQVKLGPNSAPSAANLGGGPNGSGIVGQPVTTAGGMLPPNHPSHHGSPAKGGGRVPPLHAAHHLLHPNLSGSETDVSTSNENLTQEERLMLRHMEREEPQGEETGADAAMAAAAFHHHHHPHHPHHQQQLSGGPGLHPHHLSPSHHPMNMGHRGPMPPGMVRAGPPGSTPTALTPVFPRGAPPPGGVAMPGMVEMVAGPGQRTSIQEELLAAKLAASGGRGPGQPGGLSSPMIAPRLSTPTAPGQLLESSMLSNSSKLNPSVYGHPNFGGDPILGSKVPGGGGGGGTNLGAYPLTVLGGRKENVDVTSSGAFFDPKAVNRPRGRHQQGGGGGNPGGGLTGAGGGSGDMISQLTREMKLQQQLSSSSIDAAGAPGGSSAELSSNSGSNQQLSGSNSGSNQQLVGSSGKLASGGAAAAVSSAAATSAAQSLAPSSTAAAAAVSGATGAKTTATPAGRTTSISSSSGYRSDNSIGFDSKELSVLPSAAGIALGPGGGIQHPAVGSPALTAAAALTGSNPSIADLKQQQLQNRHRNSIPSVTTLGIPGVGAIPGSEEDVSASEGVLPRSAAGLHKKGLMPDRGAVGGLAALSRSQPDLSGGLEQHLHLHHSPQLSGVLGGGPHGDLIMSAGLSAGILGGGLGSHPPHPPQFHPLGAPSAIAIALQEGDLEKTVDLLQEENRVLRCDLEDLSRRVSRVSALEQEMAKIQAAYQNLLRHSEKREALEKAARQKLQNVIVNLTEVNKEVTDRHEAVMAQLLSGDPKNQNIPGLDTILRGEIMRKDNLIGQLMNQNKMLMATKERQDVEVRAQQETLEEQRSHIQILDTALSNAQAQLLRLEEENRVKDTYAERVKQMTKSLEQLQAASEKREAMEKKLRMKLEDELRELREQQHVQGQDPGEGGDHPQGGGGPSVEQGALLELRKRLNENEEKIIRLESERTQWEQRYLEESAMRQVAIDAAAIPKDARIAALEKQGAESERLIAEARSNKMRSFEEAQQSQRKMAEMENHVKTLETALTEQSAMIRILKSNQSASAISSALAADAAAAAAAAAAPPQPTESPTQQLLNLHQRQLNTAATSPSFLGSPLHLPQSTAQSLLHPSLPHHPKQLSVSAASTPTHHGISGGVRQHSRLGVPAAAVAAANPTSASSAAIADYLRAASRSRSPSAGLNVSHADILHANLLSSAASASASDIPHSHHLSLRAPAPPPPLTLLGGGSLHLAQTRQLQQQLRQRSATPTAELMRLGAGGGGLTLPAPLPSAVTAAERRDSAPGNVLAHAMATAAAARSPTAAHAAGATLINTADLYKIPAPAASAATGPSSPARNSSSSQQHSRGNSNRSASSGRIASERRSNQLHLHQPQPPQGPQPPPPHLLLPRPQAPQQVLQQAAAGNPASAASGSSSGATHGQGGRSRGSSTASSTPRPPLGALRDTLINKSNGRSRREEEAELGLEDDLDAPPPAPAPPSSLPPHMMAPQQQQMLLRRQQQQQQQQQHPPPAAIDDSIDSIMGPMSSTRLEDGGIAQAEQSVEQQDSYMEVWNI